MPNPWDDLPDAGAEASKNPWDDLEDIEPAKPMVKPSQLESALRGAAQGGSFGFADELTGAGEAAANKLSGDERDFLDLYRKHRDESRANYEAAEKANPKTSMAGQFAGASLPAILTGGAAGLGTGIAELAGQGALQGLGHSDAKDIGDLVKDAAVGGAVGGVVGGAGQALKEIASPIARSATSAVEDLATAPIRAGGAMGLPARAVKGVTDAGQWVGNQFNKIGEVGRAGLGFATKGASVGLQGAAKIASQADVPIQAAARVALEDIIPQMGKFAGVLKNAAERGGNSLAATNFILQQSDPSYRQMLQDTGYLGSGHDDRSPGNMYANSN